jgi:hypothetical protein
MSTEKRIRWEEIERGWRYENLENFMEDARRIRSQAIRDMIGAFLTRTGRAFGNMTVPLARKMRPELPTAGKARPGAAAEVRLMRTNASAS